MAVIVLISSRVIYAAASLVLFQDDTAVVLAQEAIKQPHFDSLPMEWRRFTIIPFMHSESLAIHEQYLPLFGQLNDKSTLGFEHRHKDIIGNLVAIRIVMRLWAETLLTKKEFCSSRALHFRRRLGSIDIIKRLC